MSQTALEGYAMSRGIQNYKPVTVEENKITNLQSVITNLVKQGYKSFVIPFISTNKNSGSGHTVYVICDLQQNGYIITLIDQTKKIIEDNKKQNENILNEVRKVITNGGMNVDKLNMINGAFPSEDNIACCTEMGAPLIDVMVHKDYNFFPDLIESATQLKFDLIDIIRIRVESFIHSLEINQTVQTCMNNAFEFAFLEEHEAKILQNGKVQLPDGNIITKEEFVLGCNLGLPEFSHIPQDKKLTFKAMFITPVCEFTFLSKYLRKEFLVKDVFQDSKFGSLLNLFN